MPRLTLSDEQFAALIAEEGVRAAMSRANKASKNEKPKAIPSVRTKRPDSAPMNAGSIATTVASASVKLQRTETLLSCFSLLSDSYFKPFIKQKSAGVKPADGVMCVYSSQLAFVVSI